MISKLKKIAEGFRKDILQVIFNSRLILWIILAACLLFSFAAFFYGDIKSTFDNTVLLAEAIAKGQFFHFYEYSLEHAGTYWPAGYDILLYAFFAVWNLPVIIMHLAGDFAYMDSPAALMWCKAISVVFTLLMAGVVYKICELLDCSKKHSILAVFLLLSSLSLTAPVFIAGQYDTLPLFFMLLGLYYYLKEDSPKFYLFFLISIPLKIYGLFLLIPLILLKEKRIWAIGVKVISSCSLYLFLKVLFIRDTAYPFISGSQGEYGRDKLLKSSVEYSGYSLCLFLGVYAAICIYCYVKELNGEKEKQIYPLYICFLVFASFVALVAINDYWIIFFLPFAVILTIMNRRYYKLNVLLEMMSSGMYLLYAFINKVYPYSYPGLVTERFLSFFTDIPEAESLRYGSVKVFMEQAGMGRRMRS